MTNLLFVCAAIVLATILGIMLPALGKIKRLEELPPSVLGAQAKIIFPLMGLFFFLVLIASLNGKYNWL